MAAGTPNYNGRHYCVPCFSVPNASPLLVTNRFSQFEVVQLWQEATIDWHLLQTSIDNNNSGQIAKMVAWHEMDEDVRMRRAHIRPLTLQW